MISRPRGADTLVRLLLAVAVLIAGFTRTSLGIASAAPPASSASASASSIDPARGALPSLDLTRPERGESSLGCTYLRAK